jgi:hypothetical protein
LQHLLASRNWHLDKIASSTLLRAAQTAVHMFGGPVLQLPYLDERAPAAMTALQLDNAPGPARQQRRRLLVRDAVDSSLVVPSLLRRAFPRGAHDFERFKAFAAMHLLPLLLQAPGAAAQRGAVAAALSAAPAAALAPSAAWPLTGDAATLVVGRKKNKKWYRQGPAIAAAEVAALEAAGAFTRVLTVAVVGHGAMIRKHCLAGAVAAELNCTAALGCGSDGRIEPNVKANNNAVYEKLMTVAVTRADESGTSVVLREASGDCRLLMDAPTRAASMARTSARDLAACDDPFDVAPFIERLHVEHGAIGATACEAAADAAGVFPFTHEVTLE